jgi:hypothetical protein
VRTILLLSALCILATTHGQYWQQEVNYDIEVALNDRNNTLTGFEKIVYINNSPDTLHYIWFHLWPNAYKDERTAYGEQTLRNGSTSFYFSDKAEKGYINRLDFKVNGVSAKTEDHPQHIDITKLILPKPLAPGERITITTPFNVKLPFNFSRSGYNKKNFQVTQWYPKPAVYDGKGGDQGWHPMPYLDQGEFYSEFGKFQVRITVPAHYVVAATGVLQTASEIEWLKGKSFRNDSISKAHTKTKFVVDSNRTKTLEFVQDRVHDFAWFANPDFLVEQDTCLLPSGKSIDIFTYFTADYRKLWKNSLKFCKDAARFYSEEIGEYPYQTISAVQGVPSTGGGMEYPTITIISPIVRQRDLDIILAHEIGHNWFYGILASNERSNPWMDEGFNTFYEYKYTRKKYGQTQEYSEILLNTMVKQHRDQAISTAAEEMSKFGYAAVTYHKTAKWLSLLEEKIGTATFSQLMQEYFQQWKFRHPQPEDFINIIRPAIGNEADTYIGYLHSKGDIPVGAKEKMKIISPLKPKSFAGYLESPAKNTLLISPAIGFNSYDKLMIGGIVSNYKLPPSSFQFIAVPLYSTGAKQFNGIGRISHTTFSKTGRRQLEVFASAARFSNNKYEFGEGKTLTTSFTKFVPGFEVSFKPKDPHSTVRSFIEWKTFFIGEQPLRYREDTLFQGVDTIINPVYSKTKLQHTIHQLRIGVSNNRALYPYSADISVQHSEYFTRLAFEADYYFNYAKGGLFVRLFAGKLFYDKQQSYPYGFDINRHTLNLSGVTGYEDYQYKNYFVGRNKFDGLASHQIMIRDGGFKVGTELLAKEVGKTDNWLAAVNLSTSIPSKINPLAIFPVSIPLRFFADFGTYAEAWETGSEKSRFLYDAGIQLSLNNDMINIYLPLFYSSDFKQYVKSVYEKNRLVNTITFSLDLSSSLKNANKQLSF